MEDWKLVLIVLGCIILLLLILLLVKREKYTTPKAPPKAPPKAQPKAQPKAPTGTTPSASYIVTPTTNTGVTLTSSDFSAGSQSGGVEVNQLTGSVTWNSIELKSTSTNGSLNTNFAVIPNTAQAFQVKGTFSTDSKVPIKLNIPGYFVNDTLDKVETSLYIPANNVKQSFLFNCYITNESVTTFNFSFDYTQPVKAKLKNFKVFVGNDVTITLIHGDPTPIVTPLYPPSPSQPGKYSIKNVLLKSMNGAWDPMQMFLGVNSTNINDNGYFGTVKTPEQPNCHFFLNPKIGTTNVYTIQSVLYMNQNAPVGSFLSNAPSSSSTPSLLIRNQDDTCDWIVNQVNKGENIYTFQSVKISKNSQGSPSYLSAGDQNDNNGKWGTRLTSDPTNTVAQWHLNLA